MKSNLIKKVSGLILSLGLLTAVPTLALAQQGNYGYGYGRPGYGSGYGYNNQSYILRMAKFKGYRQGFKTGREDRFARESYGYWDDQIYRTTDQGWGNEYRFRGLYQQAFRQAFQIGYRDAFYGRSFSPAFANNPSRYDDDDDLFDNVDDQYNNNSSCHTH